MAILTKAHSHLVALQLTALGWTLRHEFRVAPLEEPYEYVFEWSGDGPPPSPFKPVAAPEPPNFRLNGMELQLICSALFFATGGTPFPEEISTVVEAHLPVLARLSESCGRVRDDVWFSESTSRILGLDQNSWRLDHGRQRRFIWLKRTPACLLTCSSAARRTGAAAATSAS